MDETQLYRIHMMYIADGMTRPLSYRHNFRDVSVYAAVESLRVFLENAYDSGFRLLGWSAENLSKPVEIKYRWSPEEGLTKGENGGQAS
jgi:hypothetical protein